jgi:hypothetical protein
MSTPTDLPPPPTSGSTAGIAHRLLYQAYVTRKLHLGMKGVLNSRRSPVHNIWENVIPYGLILLMIGNYTYTMGLKGLVLTASLGLGVGLFVVPRWVMVKVRKRTVNYAFADAASWDELWRIGGLSMRLADKPEAVCDSPDGDWRAFAMENFADENSNA